MRKYLLVILGITVVIAVSYFTLSLNKGVCIFRPSVKKEYLQRGARPQAINKALDLLRVRKDNAALLIFEKVLIAEPRNLDALWGKAEVLRRSRDYKGAEILLNRILKKNPRHIPSLISLAYIAYRDDKLEEARQLIDLVLASDWQDTGNQALAYMMLGAINSRHSSQSRLWNKIKYGTQIKRHFLRARFLAPDLPEVHLGLGTFYLLAPPIFGRNLDKAIEELETAVRIAPDFATACARLAQCYKKKGLLNKYAFYIARAKKLDPENEVLKEIEE